MRRTIAGHVAAVLALAVIGCSGRHAVAGDHCFYKGTMYSDGAAACQSGTQYRCYDGDWKPLGLACTAGAAGWGWGWRS